MIFVLVLAFASCGVNEPADRENPEIPEIEDNTEKVSDDATKIILSENSITVDGKPAEETEGIKIGGEIIYYHDTDFYESKNPYGEGNEEDKHTEAEAEKHTLVTITKPGEYVISGTLKGQLAVDLGEEAKNNPEAKVTVILNGADITCEIAPAVIFYNVYECADAEKTDEAGAKIIIADESTNYINGAYVAKIYQDGTDEKLHKYDGALYSKMSLVIAGGEKGNGNLYVTAENEGIGSEMHLTFNGGNINIAANDDGINANEDGVSVITVNGGGIIVSGGFGTEGDGIDSNGSIVINGGALMVFGNGMTGDGGIDSDMGITVTGGSLVAFGSRNDNVKAEGKATCVQLSFSSVRKGGSIVEFVDETGYGMMAESSREFQSVVFAGENLEKNKIYRLYVDNILQEYSGEGGEIMPGMRPFEGNFGRGEMNENFMSMPDGFSEWLDSAKDIPEDIKEWLEYMESLAEEYDGRMPSDFENDRPSMQTSGTFEDPPQKPKGETENFSGTLELEVSYPTEFVITDEQWSFYGITDNPESADKERLTFTINGKDEIENFQKGTFEGIKYVASSENIGADNVRLTLVYTGDTADREISKTILASEGFDGFNKMINELETGGYRITVSVVPENPDYTGSTSFNFYIGLN